MGNSSLTSKATLVARSFTHDGFLLVAYPCSPHTDGGILEEKEPGPELFSHAVNIFKIAGEKKKRKKKRRKKENKQNVYSRLGQNRNNNPSRVVWHNRSISLPSLPTALLLPQTFLLPWGCISK